MPQHTRGLALPWNFAAARRGHQNHELRAVRTFKQGMVPIVIASPITTDWILALDQVNVGRNRTLQREAMRRSG